MATAKYEAKVIGSQENGFYAFIVRIDRDGEQSVIKTYKGRHFANRSDAVRSAEKYILKHLAS